MSLLRYVSKVYSLDNLDTRFTTSGKTPPRAAGIKDGEPAKGDGDVVAKSQPSKWSTPEYYLYILICCTAVPYMLYVPYTVSQESNPDYPKYEKRLSPGWIPGRKVDNSDEQYASFRNNVPYMAIVLVVHPLLRRLFNMVYLTIAPPSGGESEVVQADARQKMRVTYDLVFTGIFLFVLHGFSAPKVLLILYLNFCIAKSLPRSYVPAATWIFNLAVLFANELCGGYPYKGIAAILLRGPFFEAGQAWGRWLDSYGGLVHRWEILFNLTTLRLISFNLDYYWALNPQADNAVEKKQLNLSSLSERDRIATAHPTGQYSFKNYLAYALYSPLYLTGPILTFNDFLAQVRYPSATLKTSRTAFYGLRLVLAVLTMEAILHSMYVVAISKSNPDWSKYTPLQLSMLGFFNLHIIWLKLLIPWRFFRLWALLDGIDPPENMVRCMSNNYSASMFWRGWHRSFNRWIVRYMFIPLGGSGGRVSQARSIGNMLVVFMFVALWHDINARLLAWSWLIVLFLMPEIICTTLLFPRRKYKDRPDTYRLLSGMGAVGNIFMMMAANLVGFALGLDGLEQMLDGIMSGWQGWLFLGAACVVLFSGAQVMFELREAEKRKGMDLKC